MKTYQGGLGFEVAHIEEVAEQRTRVAMLPAGESRVELLEPTDDASPIARFIARRGEGLHHICFRVADLEAELRRLESAGVRLIDSKPRPGAGGCLIAFVHPAGASGVLIELSQPGAGPGHRPPPT